MVEFTKEEKIKYFDEIYKYFFIDKKFDSFTKLEIQILMFKFYIDKMEEKNSLSSISNYQISNDLGITQQKAQQLRIKKQILYGKKYNISEELKKIAKFAVYSVSDELVQLNINDPNLLIEIENYLESNNQFVVKSFNNKLLQVRIQYFIGLLLNFEVEENKSEILKVLKKSYGDEKNNKKIFNEKNVGKSLLECAANISNIIQALSELKLENSLLLSFIMLFKNSYNI